MFKFQYKTTEIVVPERRYRELVEEWFESLPDNEFKEAVRRIQWRELRPQTPHFRLSVRCQHPYPEAIQAFLDAKQQDDTKIIEDAASKALGQYDEWFRFSLMPTEATIDDRAVRIDWAPLGITYYEPDNMPPQERAEYDLDREANGFLWLAHVTAQTQTEFIKTIVGKNIPFACAGMLLTGHPKMIRRCPEVFPEDGDEKELLQENIFENTAEYVILIRLAAHFGSEFELVRRVLKLREPFLREHKTHLEAWAKEYHRYETEDDFFVGAEELRSPSYVALGSACHFYRKALLEVTEGLEHEITSILNSFLRELPIPDSPFRGELEDDGEWWKTDFS